MSTPEERSRDYYRDYHKSIKIGIGLIGIGLLILVGGVTYILHKIKIPEPLLSQNTPIVFATETPISTLTSTFEPTITPSPTLTPPIVDCIPLSFGWYQHTNFTLDGTPVPDSAVLCGDRK